MQHILSIICLSLNWTDLFRLPMHFHSVLYVNYRMISSCADTTSGRAADDIRVEIAARIRRVDYEI